MSRPRMEALRRVPGRANEERSPRSEIHKQRLTTPPDGRITGTCNDVFSVL